VVRADGTHFRVWAPDIDVLTLHLLGPRDRLVPMATDDAGYHHVVVNDAGPGTRYTYRFPDGRECPDPASRFQPEGVHGPSEVTTCRVTETTGWRGRPLREYVIYELHVGTFSPEGTFEGVIPRLATLKRLGITAIELMPVAQFPGTRNWGYDGTYPYAAQHSYGGPEGLARLVAACHREGLAVILDVVYNHLGPEGNYLSSFGPYFTDRYRTPWGDAVNFDGAGSDEVRRYFIENALYWVTEMGMDALRLDAVHAIADQSAYPFLHQLADEVKVRARALGRDIHLIAESDLNDPRLIRDPDVGGFGLDAQWSDDFHHALRTVLTGDRAGYYEDFGQLRDLATAITDAYVFAHRYSAHRGRHHGAPPGDLDGSKFLAYSQNHDQVGNRMLGDRLTTLLSFEQLKLAATTVMLSRYLPLIFMGEEYGERHPFLYFTSHSDADLIEAVRKGRREEFAAFAWAGEAPDPHAQETFTQSMIAFEQAGEANPLWRFYRELIALRHHPALRSLARADVDAWVHDAEKTLVVSRRTGQDAALLVCNFSGERQTVTLPVDGHWRMALSSADPEWDGPGGASHASGPGSLRIALPAHSATLYTRT
jgi:maltooligosyltrehalose trehalohydrolase